MVEVRQTEPFRDWLEALRDAAAIKAIKRRIARIQIGLFGDVKSIGGGLYELRIDQGPGYRVYYARSGSTLILLLCGGDKSSQERDITQARGLLKLSKEP